MNEDNETESQSQ